MSEVIRISKDAASSLDRQREEYTNKDDSIPTRDQFIEFMIYAREDAIKQMSENSIKSLKDLENEQKGKKR